MYSYNRTFILCTYIIYDIDKRINDTFNDNNIMKINNIVDYYKLYLSNHLQLHFGLHYRRVYCSDII